MLQTKSEVKTRDVATAGNEIFNDRVRPLLAPTDDGKFVAIDIATGEYEIDEDDFLSVSRLLARKPAAEIWLVRAGQPAAYRIGIAL